METAQVDVRKLQMLNDRINQTIDALNQVRLSVHGMSHTAGIPNVGTPFAPTGYPVGNGYPGATAFGAAYPYTSQIPGIGFGHTGFPVNNQAYGLQNPLQSVLQNPALNNPLFTQQLSQMWGTTPFGVSNVGGFAHTGTETYDARRTMGNIDPFAATRIAQTFPFVQWGYSPFASASLPFASGMY